MGSARDMSADMVPTPRSRRCHCQGGSIEMDIHCARASATSRQAYPSCDLNDRALFQLTARCEKSRAMMQNSELTSTNSSELPKKQRKRRINPKIVQAVELWATGKARTKSEAASMVSVSPEWFGKMLKRPEIGVL